jgi:hypothetical protein
MLVLTGENKMSNMFVKLKTLKKSNINDDEIALILIDTNILLVHSYFLHLSFWIKEVMTDNQLNEWKLELENQI